MPCNNCQACLMNDCGGCKFCLDKRKFGGPGKLKKRCELRVCTAPGKKMGLAQPLVQHSPVQHKLPLQPTTFTITKQPEIRNKFLASVEIDDSDMNSSFETDSYANSKSVDTSPEGGGGGQSIQNYIYSGLGQSGETFEVVEVIQDQVEGSSYEQDMNNRAKAIDTKTEEINGRQYQVISFLPDPEPVKPGQAAGGGQQLSLDQVDTWTFPAVAQTAPITGFQPYNDLPQSYDDDFDKYLQTNGMAISLQQ